MKRFHSLLQLFVCTACLCLSVWPVAARLEPTTEHTTKYRLESELRAELRKVQGLLEKIDQTVLPQIRLGAESLHNSSVAYAQRHGPSARRQLKKAVRALRQKSKETISRAKKLPKETHKAFVHLFNQMGLNNEEGALTADEQTVANGIASQLTAFYDDATEKDKAAMREGMAKVDALAAEGSVETQESLAMCNAFAKTIKAKFGNATEDAATAERYLTILGLCIVRPDMFKKIETALHQPGTKEKLSDVIIAHDSTTRLQKRTVTSNDIAAKLKMYAKQLDAYVRTHNRGTLLFAAGVLMLRFLIPSMLIPFIAGYLVLAAYGMRLSLDEAETTTLTLVEADTNVANNATVTVTPPPSSP